MEHSSCATKMASSRGWGSHLTSIIHLAAPTHTLQVRDKCTYKFTTDKKAMRYNEEAGWQSMEKKRQDQSGVFLTFLLMMMMRMMMKVTELLL